MGLTAYIVEFDGSLTRRVLRTATQILCVCVRCGGSRFNQPGAVGRAQKLPAPEVKPVDQHVKRIWQWHTVNR